MSQRYNRGEQLRQAKPHPWLDLEPILLLLHWSILNRKGVRPPDPQEFLDVLSGRFCSTAFSILKRHGATNPAIEAHDAAQEFAIKWLNGAMANYNCRQALHRFAYKVFKNLCIDIARHSTRNSAECLPVDLFSRSDEPSQEAERNELRRIVRRGVGKLPRRKRRAIIAKYWLGYSSRAAADRINMHVGSYNRENFESRDELRGRLIQWPEVCRPFYLKRAPGAVASISRYDRGAGTRVLDGANRSGAK